MRAASLGGRAWIAAGLCALALAYLATKTLVDAESVDFKFLWHAGDLWLRGIDPYSDAYLELSRARFEDAGSNVPRQFPYPPYWWGITTGFASLDYETARLAWRILSFLLAAAGGGAMLYACHRWLAPVTPLRAVGFAAFVWAGMAGAAAIFIGQTSWLSFFALALFMAAYLGRLRPLMAVALALLMLKPTIGVIFGFLLVADRRWWPSILAGALLCILAALPALLPHGVGETLGNFASRLAGYDAGPANVPVNMTGLRNLAFHLAGAAIGPLPLAVAAILSSVAIGVAVAGDRSERVEVRAAALSLALAVGFLLMPFHTYDLMLVGALALTCARAPRLAQGLTALGLLLVWRSNNLEAVLGTEGPEVAFQGSLPASAGLAVLALAALIQLAAALRPTRPAPP